MMTSLYVFVVICLCDAKYTLTLNKALLYAKGDAFVVFVTSITDWLTFGSHKPSLGRHLPSALEGNGVIL